MKKMTLTRTETWLSTVLKRVRRGVLKRSCSLNSPTLILSDLILSRDDVAWCLHHHRALPQTLSFPFLSLDFIE